MFRLLTLKLVSRYNFTFTDDPSQSFNSFSDLLGDRIKLKGWEKFKGGLDVKCKCGFLKSFSFVIFAIYHGNTLWRLIFKISLWYILKTVSYEKCLNHINSVLYLVSVTANATGTESIYTVYEGHEIMFHVSTLLPHSLENKQQVIGWS